MLLPLPGESGLTIPRPPWANHSYIDTISMRLGSNDDDDESSPWPGGAFDLGGQQRYDVATTVCSIDSYTGLVSILIRNAEENNR